MSDQLRVPSTPPRGHNAPLPTGRRLGETQNISGHGGDDRNLSSCWAFNPSRRHSPQLGRYAASFVGCVVL
jgi:hypothetical protein